MFLPTTIKEVRARGWDALDVILFTGDAYIDHPSFGAAVIGRLLEAAGISDEFSGYVRRSDARPILFDE